ncbi:RNA-binding cell elongation regulator Jag/EloR [Halalkalibacterium ligniniphilum]|uniref:RNA-binding cell elongation regulator Jag/EloR n=1 Tax=Halalkalibacterium ligniniphilum TaxID=1134413 RepID=UPI00034D4674|nr:RNA-binding cell elongation regulator Jag/EloR [Halalkalibacterium ligniniphilum]
MIKRRVSGKTIEEAVEKAVAELETTRDRITYTVLEEPQKGFLGLLGGKPAVIEVIVKPEPVDKAFAFLEKLVANMGLEAKIEKREEQGMMIFELFGKEGIGSLIGKRGQTLDSLQYLVNLVANRDATSFVRIQLDAENYRQRRKETLEQLAVRLGEKARSIKKKVPLEPMNAHERKIIHATLQHTDGVQTYSEGQGNGRHVVIAPK